MATAQSSAVRGELGGKEAAAEQHDSGLALCQRQTQTDASLCPPGIRTWLLAGSPPASHTVNRPLHPSRPHNTQTTTVFGKIFYCCHPCWWITRGFEGWSWGAHSIFWNRAMASSTFLSSASVCCN